MSGLMYVVGAAPIVEAVHGTLGYPLHFLPLLGMAKLLGVVALFVPGFPRIREWAYAGFTINLLGAGWAHANVDGLSHVIPIAVFGVLLAISYVLQEERGGPVPARPALAVSQSVGAPVQVDGLPELPGFAGAEDRMSRFGWVLVGWVGCGDTRGSCDCDPASEYCAELHSDVPGDPTVLSCEPLPDCAPATCECLVASAEVPYNFGVCTCVDDDVLLVVCPGG